MTIDHKEIEALCNEASSLLTKGFIRKAHVKLLLEACDQLLQENKRLMELEKKLLGKKQ